MANPKLKYLLAFLLITLLCIGGVEGFYYALGRRLAADQPEKTETPASAAAVSAGSLKVQKDIDISAITRRNLFASSVSAKVEPINTDPLAGVQLSSLAVVLMGTIMGVHEQSRAIIYDKKERTQELYQEGDFIKQAAIKKILRGKVIITLNGKDEMLDIADARDVAVPQYKKPMIATTTAQRIIGRPAGSTAATQPGQSLDAETAPGGEIASDAGTAAVVWSAATTTSTGWDSLPQLIEQFVALIVETMQKDGVI
ncbi:MAG: hypothetical protein IH612_14260 [Desulfofustis sp.]|nr:hypothetical protein [Desulfofustis sp.]